MNTDCALTCPVITEAVGDPKLRQKTKLNMAEAAIKSETISQRVAAERFGISVVTLNAHLAKAATVQTSTVAASNPPSTVGKDGKSRKPPAKPEEIARAWKMKDDGMSTDAIAHDLGRGIRTVRNWFAKQRPEQSHALDKPTSIAIDDPALKDWSGELNEHGSKIYRREVVSSRKRVEMARQLREVSDALKKTMDAASKDHTVKAGALLQLDVKTVEATLKREGRPGIQETLEALIKEAGRIQTYAKATLRVFNYDGYQIN